MHIYKLKLKILILYNLLKYNMIRYQILNHYLINSKNIYNIKYDKKEISYPELYELLYDKITDLDIYFSKDIDLSICNKKECTILEIDERSEIIYLNNNDIVIFISTKDNFTDEFYTVDEEKMNVETFNSKLIYKSKNYNYKFKFNSIKKSIKKLKNIDEKYKKIISFNKK